MNVVQDARGVLVDIDGTLLRGDRAIDGADAFLRSLSRRDIPFRLITNTTRRPRSAIAAALVDAGIDVPAERILLPARLARARILASGRRRAGLLLPPSTFEDLEGVEVVESRPDWVVVGDLGDGFTWAALDRAFLWLTDGARLLALHKNRYWHDGERLRLDAGPFVAALEYAAGVEAEVLGKPSGDFYRLALEDLGVPAGGVVMIGDDVRNDCIGAKAAGCSAIVVRTGKFRPSDLEQGASPDAVVDSVADLVPD